MANEPLRVVVWATGGIGSIAIPAIHRRPDLELVGVRVYSPAKVGRDAGEIANGVPIGLAATDDVDADCLRQAFRFVEAGVGRAEVPGAAVIGQGQHGAFAAADPGFVAAIEDAQVALPSPAPSLSTSPPCPPARSSACAGWRVEIACL